MVSVTCGVPPLLGPALLESCDDGAVEPRGTKAGEP
jgi:hypothetical protein